MGALKHAVKKVVVVRWNERTFRVELEENATVGDLKRELQNLSNVKRTRIALAPVRPTATPKPSMFLHCQPLRYWFRHLHVCVDGSGIACALL